jgi:hypothetical protein
VILGGGEAVEFTENLQTADIEEKDEAEQKGPTETWTFWQQEMMAGIEADKRFRDEGLEVEREYFGDEDKLYSDAENAKTENNSNIIHANIETLKPLVYSETPEPIVRRRLGPGRP